MRVSKGYSVTRIIPGSVYVYIICGSSEYTGLALASLALDRRGGPEKVRAARTLEDELGYYGHVCNRGSASDTSRSSQIDAEIWTDHKIWPRVLM